MFLLILLTLSGIFQHLTLDDGMSDIQIYAMAQDDQGYLWMGSRTSVMRFDGYQFCSYPFSGEVTQDKKVTSIACHSQRGNWVGNGAGLWHIDAVEGLQQMVHDQIPFGIEALAFDSLGQLFVGSKQGLYIEDPAQPLTFRRLLMHPNELSLSNSITGLAFDSLGHLWLASESGLHRLTLDTQELAHYSLPDMPKFNALVWRDGQVILSSRTKGLFLYDTRRETFAPYPVIQDRIIRSLSVAPDGNLIVGTDGDGVHIISPQDNHVATLKQSNQQGSISSNSIYSVLAGTHGELFVGHYQTGLDYMLTQHDDVRLYHYRDFSTKGMPVRALCIHEEQRIIGTQTDGFWFIDESDGRMLHYSQDQLGSFIVLSVLYRHGHYLIGTYGSGIWEFNPANASLRPFTLPDVSANPTLVISSLQADEMGNLWIASNCGLFLFDSNDRFVSRFTKRNSTLPGGSIYEIYFDSLGRGWICAEDGLAVWDPLCRTLRTDIFPDNFINNSKIRHIFEDHQHRLWFIPDYGILWRCNTDLTDGQRLDTTYPTIGSNSRFGIETPDSSIWIGTASGLYELRADTLFRSYDFVDGLPDQEFTLCEPVIDARGKLWLGCKNGLLYIDTPHTRRPVHEPRNVQITHADIMPDQVTIAFSDMSYTHPRCRHYEYWLEGVDDSWVSFDDEHANAVSYHHLGWGSYKFHVRSRGDCSEGTVYEFRIPFTMSDLLRYLGILSLLILLPLTGRWLWSHRQRTSKLLRLMRRLWSQQSPPEAKPKGSDDTIVTEQVASPASVAEATTTKYQTVNVTGQEATHLVELLHEVVYDQKLFLDPELKATDVAERMGIKPHTLSYLFSQHLDTSFSDYIYRFRVEEFKRLVPTTDWNQTTILTLARQCGFNSKTSFNLFFKRIEGMTPHEYISRNTN